MYMSNNKNDMNMSNNSNIPLRLDVLERAPDNDVRQCVCRSSRETF